MTAKTYLVGGAVRDELLGRATTDFDYVVVGATYDELAASYGDPVGADFPVFIDPADGAQYAMARRERKTGVGYHGFECEFGSNVTLKDDLMRRDLTINALAKDCETGEIIDYFGGLQDLRDKVLRHTSEAFVEDPLRVIRLARFAARYDFAVAPETRVLAQQVVDSGELNALPYERYWLEISKAVYDGNVGKFFRVLSLFGVFSKVKFFKEVWGDFHVADTLSQIDKVARVLRYAREESRFVYFVALTAKDDLPARLHALPTHIHLVHEGIRRVNKMHDLEVEPIFDLFKFAKVWSEGAHLMQNIILGVELLNATGHVTAVWPDELKEMVTAVRKVTSEPYQHLEGKAIGDAMNKERKAIIERLIAVF